MVEDETQQLPALPDEWVPEDAVFFAVAKHHKDDDVWEFVVPEYAIVGRGDSFREAGRQAGDLLADYFRICAEEGVSFADAGRPMSPAWFARELSAAAVDTLVRRIRHTSAKIRLLRMPAGPVGPDGAFVG